MSTCRHTPAPKPTGEYTQSTFGSTQPSNTTTSLYRAAEKTAKAKLGFYIHAAVFVLVSAMQFGINLFTTPWVFWSVFPFMGWGLGLAIHGLVVWFKTSDFLEHLIEEELEKLQSPQAVETPTTSSVTLTEKPLEQR